MITIKDLARECNVSVSLVSRAFNGYSDINEQTKQRILATANELGYVPNTNARALAKKNINKIAIIVRTTKINNFADEIPFTYASNSFTYANSKGYESVILFTDIFKGKTQDEITSHLKSLGITGVILFGINDKQNELYFLTNSTHFKCVMIDTALKNQNTSSVIINDSKAQYDILKKLKNDVDFSNILYLAGSLNSYTGLQRLNGIKKFNKEHHIEMTFAECHFNEKESYNYILENYNESFNIIVCANDIMAIGVINALNKLNIHKPIYILGFDGISLLNYINYPVLTVKQDFKQKARLATEKLIDLFDNKESEIVYADYMIEKNHHIQ